MKFKSVLYIFAFSLLVVAFQNCASDGGDLSSYTSGSSGGGGSNIQVFENPGFDGDGDFYGLYTFDTQTIEQRDDWQARFCRFATGDDSATVESFVIGAGIMPRIAYVNDNGCVDIDLGGGFCSFVNEDMLDNYIPYASVSCRSN